MRCPCLTRGSRTAYPTSARSDPSAAAIAITSVKPSVTAKSWSCAACQICQPMPRMLNTLSTTSAPPTICGKLSPISVTTGTREFLSTCATTTRRWPAPRARAASTYSWASVSIADERMYRAKIAMMSRASVSHRQRQRPYIGNDAADAGRLRAVRGEHVPVHCEEQDQDRAEHERWHAVEHQGHTAQHVIDGRVPPHGLEQPYRDRDHQGDHGRADGQHQRPWQAGREQRADALVQPRRETEVAVQDPADPGEVLGQEHLMRRTAAKHGRDRAAGSQPDQPEHDERHEHDTAMACSTRRPGTPSRIWPHRQQAFHYR